MEPGEQLGRVSDVSSSQQGALSGEIPAMIGEVPNDRPEIPATIGEPRPRREEVPRMIGEMTFPVSDSVADFDEFYVAARRAVGRALAVTLRDVDLAADAVDEAMVRAYQRWETVGRLDNPAGWVYRVGLNHARSRLRRLMRRLPAHRESEEFTVADPSIDEALSKLSYDHRAVVVCRLLFGWSEAQTASALDIRPGTVKSRLHRATNQLQRHLHHLRPEDS